MSKDDRDIVSVVQRALAERIGIDRFELWFRTHIEFEITRPLLRVSSKNAFCLERVRKAFRDDLEAVAAENIAADAQVQFRLTPMATGATAPPAASPSIPVVARTTTVPAAPPTPQEGSAPTTSPPQRAFHSLHSFVVGENNRLAYVAACQVAKRLGQVSPLFIHGPTGSGKSHLLEGIATNVRQTSRERRVVSLSAEQFTSGFLEALQGGGIPMFRRKYRDLDLLLIDDIQFFAGKKATMQELQNILDHLARAGKQLVLTADRAPAELKHLGAELVGRIAGGLVVGVASPDETTRRGVLKQIAARLGIEVPEEALHWLAVHLPGDARSLRGALHRLAATSEAYQRPITLELTMQATRDLMATTPRVVQLIDIERAVCNIFGITPEALHAPRRTKKFSQPRSLAMWLARKHTRSALVEIGEYFGRRSHSTVIAAHNNVEKWRTGGETVSFTGGECPLDDAIQRVEAQLRLA